MSKSLFSLSQQIEEIERELVLRKRVYPGLIHKGTMTQSIANYHMGRIEGAKASLEWLRANETDVRAFVAAKAEARKKCPDCVGTGRRFWSVALSQFLPHGSTTDPEAKCETCETCGGRGAA